MPLYVYNIVKFIYIIKFPIQYHKERKVKAIEEWIKMADSFNISNGSVCSVFDTYDYVVVAAVSSGSAMVSALCCIFVIGLIFLLKKQHFFIQRIILYHCLAALFRAIALILRLHRLGYRSESAALNGLCVFSGFTNQLTFWFLYMDYSVITFLLLMTAVFHKNVARLEGLYIFLIFVFPFTFNWIPFINNSYGRVGPWCGIRILNYDDCSEHKFGIIIQDILSSIPFYAFFMVAIPILIFIIIYLVVQRYCRLGGAEHDQEMKRFKERLNEQVLPLLFFPFGVVILNIVPAITSIHLSLNPDRPLYALWILGAILSPLQGGYIALVYTLDRDTLRRLTYSNLFATLCRRQEDVHEYPIVSSGRSDSILSDGGFESTYKILRDGNEQVSLTQDKSDKILLLNRDV